MKLKLYQAQIPAQPPYYPRPIKAVCMDIGGYTLAVSMDTPQPETAENAAKALFEAVKFWPRTVK